MLQNWKKDQRGDTGGKAAVVEHEAAVEIAGCGAHGCAHETCGDTGADSVASDDRTEAGCKGNTVDITLGGDGPGNIASIDAAEEHGHDIKEHISSEDRQYISRMLTHGCEGQSCENNTDGRSGKSGTRGENNDCINISQENDAVYADIDEAERHSVFFGKITGKSGISHQIAVSMERFSVEPESNGDAEEKGEQEKEGGKQLVAVTEGFIDIIGVFNDCRRGNTHGLIHKVEYKKSKHTESKTTVIEVIAFVPCFCARKNCRNHKSDDKSKAECQRNSRNGQFCNAECERVILSIAE